MQNTGGRCGVGAEPRRGAQRQTPDGSRAGESQRAGWRNTIGWNVKVRGEVARSIAHMFWFVKWLVPGAKRSPAHKRHAERSHCVASRRDCSVPKGRISFSVVRSFATPKKDQTLWNAKRLDRETRERVGRGGVGPARSHPALPRISRIDANGKNQTARTAMRARRRCQRRRGCRGLEGRSGASPLRRSAGCRLALGLVARFTNPDRKVYGGACRATTSRKLISRRFVLYWECTSDSVPPWFGPRSCILLVVSFVARGARCDGRGTISAVGCAPYV